MPIRRFRVTVAAVPMLAALLTLTGCVTVHGEEVLQPAVHEDEAGRILDRFGELNNKANEEYDLDVNSRIEAGGLREIDQAGLRVRKADYPEGNPDYQPLEFSDTRYLIPQQRGWPRWFVADTLTNRNELRWLLVFVKEGPEARWHATHLSLLDESEITEIGEFAEDGDGHVRRVPLGASAGLTVAPGQLGKTYAAYLKDGAGDDFAPGQHTSERVGARDQYRRTPEYVTQYVDEATPEYPPVGLRLADGGALVLFSSRHFVKQTVAEGREVEVPSAAEPLMKGTPEKSLTMERVSQQAVVVPPRDDKGDGIVFYNRLEGLVGAGGS
ncbi:hypothetical protein O7599_29950 [Streptomyces sp. WMMC500]|uniref:hypothetical protein n=1 Tax=Streptomyces sp. WMMC500 TaxID=3015154 RepID=UPI00248C15E3|nr:hypothetical protein [Streptomyces sp. WMMC500]WBB59736.1 hypothetical protein O7599_29950 [Streptomyces sp. WMMC500]